MGIKARAGGRWEGGGGLEVVVEGSGGRGGEWRKMERVVESGGSNYFPLPLSLHPSLLHINSSTL